MQIKSLKLSNFRNYKQLFLTFSNNNIIYGKNGMGKTNLVEAIYLLAITKTFRSTNERIVIKENEDFTKVIGVVFDDIDREYQIILSKDGKRVKIDNNIVKKISDYISKVKVILFNPNDLQIIKDSPSVRRKLINISIAELDNLYLKLLNDYNKLLKQRNAYLKTMYVNSNHDSNYLVIITERLVDLGIKIHDFRQNYLDNINCLIGDVYAKISTLNGLKIEYISSFNYIEKNDILKKYNDYQEKDMLFGTTRFGIHHDDIRFKLGERDLKEYGSEGQQKNAIIAYKLAEIQVFRKLKGKIPIFILDDLFSELDIEKINNILNLLDNSVQTFITTTEIDKVSQRIKDNSKIFHITENGVEEEI